MRILHVIPSVSSIHGGPSRAIVMMEQALSQRGVSVTTLTTDDDGPGRRLSASVQAMQDGGAFRIYLRKHSEFYKFAPSIFSWLRANLAGYDVVHVHALFSFTSIAAAFIARREGVPYVIRPLGTLNRYGLKQRRQLLKRLSLSLIEGPLLRGAAAVHFTSAAEAAEAAELGIALNGLVIPLGIVPETLDGARSLVELPPEANSRPVLLYLSRLDPVKNVEGLLRACALLRQRSYEFALLIAGGGNLDYVAEMKRLATLLALDDEIVWLGRVEGERKAAALAAADVFVLPSFSENFGIAVVEAMLAGLPCILSKGIAIADEVQAAGAGLTVEPTPEAIAEGIAKLLDSPETCSEMAGRAESFASREYSAATMSERLEMLYRSLIKDESVSLNEHA